MTNLPGKIEYVMIWWGSGRGIEGVKKRKSNVYAVTGPGRGMGEGEASPSPPRRENFEISLPSNGVS